MTTTTHTPTRRQHAATEHAAIFAASPEHAAAATTATATTATAPAAATTAATAASSARAPRAARRVFGLAPAAFAAAATALALAPTAHGSDSGPLLDMLARKGVITAQEAENLRVELAAENNASLAASIAKGKATQSLVFSGRLQVQYDGFDDNIQAARPNSHFFLRRVYFGADATLGNGFSASLNYDFAGSSFDKLFVSWVGRVANQDVSVDAGLRKVNFGLEETTSSGSLESIERSAATRYFAEDANGRRLGAASYRIGLFIDGNKAAAAGKTSGVFYGAAVTNPERVGAVTAIGDRVTNTIALWGNVGCTAKFSAATVTLGVAGGYLPSQGGVVDSTTKSREDYDLAVGSIYGAFKTGKFSLKAEFLAASSEKDTRGVGTKKGRRKDTMPWGFWVQPSFRVTDEIEITARYSYLNSDERGVKLSDGVRNAPSGDTAEFIHEWYLGATYYFLGNDLKFQLGYAGGHAVVPGKDNATAHGIRSQIQLNF